MKKILYRVWLLETTHTSYAGDILDIIKEDEKYIYYLDDLGRSCRLLKEDENLLWEKVNGKEKRRLTRREACPICAGLIYRIDASENVCAYHQKRRIVTQCKVCGRYCFSSKPGICRKCDV